MHPSQTGVVIPFLEFNETQFFGFIFLFPEIIISNFANSDILVTSDIVV